MPQIIVTADGGRDNTTVMWRERITIADLQSGHFARQLLERLGWAVGDAQEREHLASSLTRDAIRDGAQAPASVVTTAS
jgi:hypothetical protein